MPDQPQRRVGVSVQGITRNGVSYLKLRTPKRFAETPAEPEFWPNEAQLWQHLDHLADGDIDNE